MLKEKKQISKYKAIFKKWWFWGWVILSSLKVIYLDLLEYEFLFISEIIGIFLGSFISITLLCWFLMAVWSGLKKLFKGIKVKVSK